MQGLIGKKIGMTRVFNERGEQVPVTVLECGPCLVLQRKRAAGADGYDAVQLGFGDAVERRLSRPATAPSDGCRNRWRRCRRRAR